MKSSIFAISLLALGLTACVEREYVPVVVEAPTAVELPQGDDLDMIYDEIDPADGRVLYINDLGDPVYCYYNQAPFCPN